MRAAGESPLLTDLYQFTMLQAYFDQGMEETAVFEFFVRRLPPERGFLLAAGLEHVLEWLERFCFSAEELHWLARDGRFRPAFIDYLGGLRFTGDVHAMPEGTVFFANEPILRVTAALPQAQLVESRLINLLHYPTLVASKAARQVLVAPGRLLVDFGMRRSHGAEAALLAARASYLAGFAGTSTVLAGSLFDIPTYGTMAHSFVQAHDDEVDAFRNFALAHPLGATLLLDTYDTEAAAEKLAALAPELRQQGIALHAVRLDSGDLAEHARRVRRILDKGGLADVRIFASGNLDESALEELLKASAPIDGFGMGTRLDVSDDVPYLDCAYKLEEYAGRPRRKRSEGKATLPGRKQVYRNSNRRGRLAFDVVTLEGDSQPGEELIQPVMRAGRRLGPPERLAESRARAARQLASLPEPLRELRPRWAYPVRISSALAALVQSLDRTDR